MIEHDADLKGALRHLPAPEPSPELLQRILRSRSMGRRTTVPTLEATTSWRWIAAAAAVVLLLSGSWAVSLSLSKIGESRRARRALDELLRGTMLEREPSRAPTLLRDVLRPPYPLIVSETLDTSRLAAGLWTYRSETTTDDILTEPAGGNRVRLSRTSLAGRPVWMVTTARRFRTESWSPYEDTTYLDPSSLRPLRAFATMNKGRTRLEQRFFGDSGYESVVSTRSMKVLWQGAVAFPFSHNALFSNSSWGVSRALFPALPLQREWQGSLYQVAFIARLGLQGVSPVNLRVVGTDRVTVPAGTFECWRLEVQDFNSDFERPRMWVSRDKGWLIKEEHAASDFVYTRVLESFEPLE